VDNSEFEHEHRGQRSLTGPSVGRIVDVGPKVLSDTNGSDHINAHVSK
jgi:hypothetical protein